MWVILLELQMFVVFPVGLSTRSHVMAWVGHTSLETIQRYATKVKVRQLETRKKAESAFTKFASVGD